MKKNDIDSLDQNFSKVSIETISQTNQKKIDDLYASIKNEADGKEKTEKIIKETREMIPQIDGRIHYWDNRRTQFLQIALGILGAALAGLITVTPDINSSIVTKDFPFLLFVYIPIFIICIALIIGSIRILILWNKQNNPSYPFNKSIKIWRWQYRHAETTEINTEIQKYDAKILEEQAYIYANNLAEYKIKTMNSTNIELLDQDLSQLYLLIINEKFKIKFISSLRNLFQEMLINAFYFGVGTFAFLIIIKLIFF